MNKKFFFINLIFSVFLLASECKDQDFSELLEIQEKNTQEQVSTVQTTDIDTQITEINDELMENDFDSSENLQEIYAITESDLKVTDINYEFIPPYSGYIYSKDIPEWMSRSRRWFRTNAGGIIIEEMPSRLSALRHDYSISVDFALRDELPDELLSYYNDDEHYIEVRSFYKNGIQTRTQWIFRDFDARTKVVAVISEVENNKDNFIEIYDNNGIQTAEHSYNEEGKKIRFEYNIVNSLLVSSSFFEEDVLMFSDSFRYNRTRFLRSIERTFFEEGELSFVNEPIKVTLPNNMRDAVNDRVFLGARYNSLPDFFGVASIGKDFKIIYTTDDRNNIISQTLYDNNDNVIWIITNTWKDERIISSAKKEGDTEMSAVYEYDINGNIISERNFRNGILERHVRIDQDTETEDIYINNILVLRAVWVEGRKISETRMNNW